MHRWNEARKPHPTLSKGEGFKMLFKVSPFGGDLEGAPYFVPRNDDQIKKLLKKLVI
jgi:hypothetical protein